MKNSNKITLFFAVFGMFIFTINMLIAAGLQNYPYALMSFTSLLLSGLIIINASGKK